MLFEDVGWVALPGMTDADDMVDIAQREFEEFVGENAPSIGEAEQTMIREDSPQAHGPRM